MTTGAKGRDRRIAVVGAGPGGLTAAMILAHRGFEVEVFEARDRVGGRNACLELGPHRFDTGPTFLMMRYILDEVFEEAGADSSRCLRFVELDPMYRLQFRDTAIRSSTDHERMRQEIAEAFPGREDSFQRFFAAEGRRFRRMAPCLQKHYSTLGSFFSLDLMRVLPYLSLGRSVFDVLEGYFGDPRLALAFSFQSKYLGMSPWECPGAFSMLSYIEYAYGVYHTIGGLSAISDAMAEVARANGVLIHLDTPVSRVLVENGSARGVALADGSRIEADEVVINADFAHAMENLVAPEALRKYTAEGLQKRRFSCSIFMLYLGLDTVYSHLPHHTIYFADDYRHNVDAIFGSGELCEDTSFYVRNAVVTDDTLAPAGHSGLYVLVPVPNLRAGTDWSREAKGFRDLVMSKLRTRAGLADIEAHITHEHMITPQDWRDDYRVYAGAVFNLAHTVRQMLYLRPRNRFEEFDHAYLVGGGTHPGSGLPTIYESGRIAANLISRRHRVPFTSANRHA
ncbi:MAG: phytoene desaturase [Lentisphaeria bacterium]|nr:phytoene desaturase [Lentisphaeria bacterium]